MVPCIIDRPLLRLLMPYRVSRSFSIYDGKSGEQVWDSGDFIGTYLADPANGFDAIFNSEGGERKKTYRYSIVVSERLHFIRLRGSE